MLDPSSDAHADNVLNRWLHERNRIWSAPSATEEARLKETMAEKQRAISSIDAQLDVLQRQRASLQHQLKSCQSLLSPIRRLPPDILIEIFRYLNFQITISSQRRNRGIFNKLSWSCTRNDAIVSTVCVGWNTIVCNFAQFWTSFNFQILELAPISEPEVLVLQNLLSTAVQRSMNAPLLVYIAAENTEDECQSYHISDLLQPILAEVHRWKHLDIAITPYHLADEGLSCFAGDLTALESLVYREDCFIGSEHEGKSDWFSYVPRLRELLYDSYTMKTFDLPWGQLESLAVQSSPSLSRGLEDNTYADILASATSLHRLTSNYQPDETDIGRQKTLLPITSLEINEHCTDLEFLTTYFKLPQLTNLVIKSIRGPIVQSLVQVAATLRRLELDINHCECFPLFCLGSDSYFPELVELSVSSAESSGYGEALDAFHAFLESLDSRLPRLAQFECSLAKGVSITASSHGWFSVLRHFTERSAATVNPVEVTKTRLRLHGPVPHHAIPVLRDLIASGTAVDVIYPGSPTRNTTQPVTWALQASDVQSMESMILRENLLSGIDAIPFEPKWRDIELVH